MTNWAGFDIRCSSRSVVDDLWSAGMPIGPTAVLSMTGLITRHPYNPAPRHPHNVKDKRATCGCPTFDCRFMRSSDQLGRGSKRGVSLEIAEASDSQGYF